MVTSLCCYGYSDFDETYVIRNFHLSSVQLSPSPVPWRQVTDRFSVGLFMVAYKLLKVERYRHSKIRSSHLKGTLTAFGEILGDSTLHGDGPQNNQQQAQMKLGVHFTATCMLMDSPNETAASLKVFGQYKGQIYA